MHSDITRGRVAWLLWCANQGYLNAEDRAALEGNGSTFIAEMSQNSEDLADLPHWLGMADEVLDALGVREEQYRSAFCPDDQDYDMVRLCSKWRPVDPT